MVFLVLTHQCVGTLVFEGCWRLEGFGGAGMGLRGGLVASRRVAWKMLLLLLFFWEMDGTWKQIFEGSWGLRVCTLFLSRCRTGYK